MMKIMKATKRLLALLLAAAMTLAMAACGGSETPDQTEASTAAAPAPPHQPEPKG